VALFENHHILISAEIQRQFLFSSKRRRNTTAICEEYLLLPRREESTSKEVVVDKKRKRNNNKQSHLPQSSLRNRREGSGGLFFVFKCSINAVFCWCPRS
jgi:hypothetical protein